VTIDKRCAYPIPFGFHFNPYPANVEKRVNSE